MMSNSHLVLGPRLLEALRSVGRADLPVHMGGILPQEDIPVLIKEGISRCFTTGTGLLDIVEAVKLAVKPRAQVLPAGATATAQLARDISVAHDGKAVRAGAKKRRPKRVIGVTGSPGAGKSTLAAQMVGEFVRAAKEKGGFGRVAVVAFDPMSPITGGAYSLQGTIGQPDASGAITGGTYTIAGGYWVPGVGALAPTVAAATSSNLTATTVDLGSNVTADGGSGITARGFVYSIQSTNSDPLIGGTGVTNVVVSGTTGALSASLAGLAPSTTYAFKAYAMNIVGTTYSAVATFTTAGLTMSIGDTSAAEGNSGATPFTFTVTLSAPASSTVTVNYATANGTAVSGKDYIATSGSITFLAGEVSKTLTVSVVGDLIFESNETFTVSLSGASGASITSGTATGTITNDDRKRYYLWKLRRRVGPQ